VIPLFQISEHIERLVQLLHGDEPKIASVDDEFEEPRLTPETQIGITKGSESSARPAEDDEDFRIEEV